MVRGVVRIIRPRRRTCLYNRALCHCPQRHRRRHYQPMVHNLRRTWVPMVRNKGHKDPRLYNDHQGSKNQVRHRQRRLVRPWNLLTLRYQGQRPPRKVTHRVTARISDLIPLAALSSETRSRKDMGLRTRIHFGHHASKHLLCMSSLRTAPPQSKWIKSLVKGVRACWLHRIWLGAARIATLIRRVSASAVPSCAPHAIEGSFARLASTLEAIVVTPTEAWATFSTWRTGSKRQPERSSSDQKRSGKQRAKKMPDNGEITT